MNHQQLNWAVSALSKAGCVPGIPSGICALHSAEGSADAAAAENGGGACQGGNAEEVGRRVREGAMGQQMYKPCTTPPTSTSRIQCICVLISLTRTLGSWRTFPIEGFHDVGF